MKWTKENEGINPRVEPWTLKSKSLPSGSKKHTRLRIIALRPSCLMELSSLLLSTRWTQCQRTCDVFQETHLVHVYLWYKHILKWRLWLSSLFTRIYRQHSLDIDKNGKIDFYLSLTFWRVKYNSLISIFLVDSYVKPVLQCSCLILTQDLYFDLNFSTNAKI